MSSVLFLHSIVVRFPPHSSLFSFSLFFFFFYQMVSSLTVASSVTPSVTNTSCSSSQRYNGLANVSFRLSSKPNLFFSTKDLFLEPSVTLKASIDGSSNAAANPSDINSSHKPSPAVSASEESISEFFTQVASIVKLVDSKDIVELQLKQRDFELIIRKKEALPQVQTPVVMMHSPSPQAAISSHYAPAQQVAAPTPAGPVHSSSPAPIPPPAVKSAKSSLPSLKCPMAGTFYRSSGPGEPPFVKVGDQVKKGQVLCIIEAMKLMNEIEADQSGRIVEVLAEDGKPVSVDMPLFVIEPQR
ncbi:biotin carboxyl carrier protein of acetyl-CoA carboxylase, chloroplastic-like isoform X2 [Tasmannia lanceolata]|uniref:biotin carboxyl carrier protein of acetyl-CoA carboxylase, chloroplastic-like isoform X2 n=1 Tax=Tasmannia lanceolata TaxID=3420 RepID=UPI0040631211